VSVRNGVQRRGTTNGNARGSNESRRRRREWLVATWRADVDLAMMTGPVVIGWVEVPLGLGLPACRCYRCGTLLIADTVSVDRIIPGCQGGTYRRDNIRPACELCNSITGGAVRREPITGGSTRGGKTVARLNYRTNGRRRGSRNGAAVSAPAMDSGRKTAPCHECGAQPGFSCNSLTSVRQVREGREGAYLKPMAKLHRSRGAS
jgi:hypothetical protein